MLAQARSLLELHFAAWEIADVRVKLSMSIEVFNQVLLLSKAPATYFAHVFLDPQMDGQKVSFKAETR